MLPSTPSPLMTDVASSSRVQSILQNLRKALQCAICLGSLNRPKMTRCGHVFCDDCIARSMESISSCPICHTDINVIRHKKRRRASHGAVDEDGNREAFAVAFSDLDKMVNLVSKLLRSIEGSSHVDTPSQVDPAQYNWKPLKPLKPRTSHLSSTSTTLRGEDAKSSMNTGQKSEREADMVFDFPLHSIQSQPTSFPHQQEQQHHMPVSELEENVKASVFRVGEKVRVAARSWPGMNKLGGIAWVISVNYDQDGINCLTYDVKYVLDNTKDRGVEAKYLTAEQDLPRSQRSTRSSSQFDKRTTSLASKSGGQEDTNEKENTKADHGYKTTAQAETIKLELISTSEGYTELGDRSFKKTENEPIQITGNKIRKIKIVSTSLNERETQILERFARQFCVATSNDVEEEDVTHLVARVDDKNIIKQRTMKYLVSIMKGMWVVSVNWLTACIKEGKIVDEVNYQADKDAKSNKNTRDVPHTARLAKPKSPLFVNSSILLYGSYPSPSPNKSQLSKLISHGNGTVYETLDSLWSNILGMNFQKTSEGILVHGSCEGNFDFDAQIVVIYADQDNLNRLFIDLDCYIASMKRHFCDDQGSSSSSCNNDIPDDYVKVYQEISKEVGELNFGRKYRFEKTYTKPHGKKRSAGKDTSIGYVAISIVHVSWVLDCISNFQVLSTADTKYTDGFRTEVGK